LSERRRQAIVRARVVGLELERSAVLVERFRRLVQRVEVEIGQIDMRQESTRIETDGFLVSGLGLGGLALPDMEAAHGGLDMRGTRVDLLRLAQPRFRFVAISLCDRRLCKAERGSVPLRIDPQTVAKCRFGGLVILVDERL
jgi:hypothetical protein